MKLHGPRRTMELEEGDEAVLHVQIAGQNLKIPLSHADLEGIPWPGLAETAHDWARSSIERAVIVIEEADKPPETP